MPHQHALVLLLHGRDRIPARARGQRGRAACLSRCMRSVTPRLVDFPVSALVQGAERGRKLDIAMTIWVLKGPDGRTVLVDAGFYRPRFVKRGTASPTTPDRTRRLGGSGSSRRRSPTSSSHTCTGTMPTVSTCSRRRRSGSRRTSSTTTPARPSRRAVDDANTELDEVSAMVKLNTQGRVHLVDGDAGRFSRE